MYDKFFGITVGMCFILIIIIISICICFSDSIEEEKEIRTGTYYVVDSRKENNWVVISPGGHTYQIERDGNMVYVKDAEEIAANQNRENIRRV